MKDITDYLKQTKSAVEKLYDAYYSYLELIKYPRRPILTFSGDPDSEENISAYEIWQEKNKEIIQERNKRDDEFAFEAFARSTLAGSILQISYHGIKLFSTNESVPSDFDGVIKRRKLVAKFCIGRLIDNIPLGLIVYAGRNQAMHYDEDNLQEPSKTVFYKLANWYSPRFKKWFVNSYYDLTYEHKTHYADNILYKLDWTNYYQYEKDMIEMLNK